jgi:hypothetical protein
LGLFNSYVTRFYRIVLIYALQLDQSEASALDEQRSELCNNPLTDIPQIECPFLHVVDVFRPDQAACTTFAVVWAPDAGTERDFWSRQLG